MNEMASNDRPIRRLPHNRALTSLGLVAAALLCACESMDDLGGMGDGFKQTTPSEAARMAVDPTDPDKRREGITMLSNAPFGGVETYVKFYRDAVTNERDPIVKAAAIQALGKHGEPADAVRIAPSLADSNQQVRWGAAKALQRLHNPAVVPDLLRVLGNENENQDVRIAAATALGQYPEDRVFQGLVGSLNARELAINAAAEESLRTLTGMSFNMSAPDWLAWYNGEMSSSDPAARLAVFAGQEEYVYPVYSRKVKWWEKLAFWSPKTFEQPAPPVGLKPEGGRRTYEDSDTSGANGGYAPTQAPTSGSTTPAATSQPEKRTTYGDG
jgi:hypothetical protein